MYVYLIHRAELLLHAHGDRLHTHLVRGRGGEGEYISTARVTEEKSTLTSILCRHAGQLSSACVLATRGNDFTL